jgi:predicted N-acetyltransferase YhbS
VHIEIVNPSDHAGPAAQLLRRAWQPPCLHYTADYVRWQLRFPGPHPAQAVAAWEGGEMVGFAGLTPRRIRFGHRPAAAYVLSFVAVYPVCRGRGLAAGLYAALLDAVRGTEVPIIGFALLGSAGQRTLLRAYEAAGLRCRPLGEFQTYGFHSPRLALPPDVSTEEPAAADLVSVIEACVGPRTLWSAPDARQLDHYRQDLRPRALVLVRGPDRQPAGAGLVVRADMATAKGVQPAVTVESVFLPWPEAGTLRALLDHAARRWPSAAGPTPVMAPNLQGLDAALLRSAGVRQVAPGFAGYVGVADPTHPLLGAESTNLEIV